MVAGSGAVERRRHGAPGHQALARAGARQSRVAHCRREGGGEPAGRRLRFSLPGGEEAAAAPSPCPAIPHPRRQRASGCPLHGGRGAHIMGRARTRRVAREHGCPGRPAGEGGRGRHPRAEARARGVPSGTGRARPCTTPLARVSPKAPDTAPAEGLAVEHRPDTPCEVIRLMVDLLFVEHAALARHLVLSVTRAYARTTTTAGPMIVRAAALALLVSAVGLPGAAAKSNASTYLYLKTTGYSGAVDVVPSGTQVGECSTYCTFAFTPGQDVTLTAQPGSGQFLGWSPWANNYGSMCSGQSRVCRVTLNSSTAIQAVFSPVSLRVVWTDGGFVTVRNPGRSCGSGCYLYDRGARASIQAQSVGDNTFSGWSGGCANAGTNCGVNMSENRVLGASFRCTGDPCTITQGLTTKLNFWVKVIGGSVTGSVTCSGSCYKVVGVGQQVSLASSSGRVQWLSRVFRCSSGSTRCTFKVGTNSTSSSPMLVVRFY